MYGLVNSVLMFSILSSELILDRYPSLLLAHMQLEHFGCLLRNNLKVFQHYVHIFNRDQLFGYHNDRNIVLKKNQIFTLMDHHFASYIIGETAICFYLKSVILLISMQHSNHAVPRDFTMVHCDCKAPKIYIALLLVIMKAQLPVTSVHTAIHSELMNKHKNISVQT